MSTSTKKQHYVWESYLKAWASDNQIWSLREGRVFKSSTENVAQERYFYEANELSQAEIKLVERMLNSGSETSRAVNLDTFKTYLLVSEHSEESRRFGVEWHHGIVERKALPIMEGLRSGDASVLNNKQEKINFCIFLGQQYMRTKKIKNSWLPFSEDKAIPDEYKNCDFQKVYEILTFVYANNLGAYIHDALQMRLVENRSGIELITSDQPIYNLLATPGKEATKTSIYYPISPLLAIFAKKTPNDEKIDSEDDVVRLNSFMVNNSHEFVFSTSQEQLKNLI